MTRKHIIRIVMLFLIWRAALFGLAVVANKILPYAPSFPYASSLLPSFHLPQWIYSFANFDGVHYLTIAKEGYTHTDFIQAFFPLYPYVLMHGIQMLLPSVNLLLLGLYISNLSFLGVLIIGFDWIQQRYSSAIAWRFVLAILVFPWSLFLASVYTESVFLFLIVLCFWFADKKMWLAAGVCAIGVSATRIVGIFIVPALLLELYFSSVIPAKAGIQSFVLKEKKNIAYIFLGILGLLAYMLYLQLNFHDALYFVHVQSSFGAGRGTHAVLYPQVVWRSFKILLTNPINLKWVTYAEEFLAGTLGLIALLLGYRKISSGVLFFSLAIFLFPPLSGSFLSQGRFLLPCISLYMWIALCTSEHRKCGIVWYLLSTSVLIVNTLLFIQGYWVA